MLLHGGQLDLRREPPRSALRVTNRLRQVVALLAAGQWPALREKLSRRLQAPPLRAVRAEQFWDRATAGGRRKLNLHIAPALGGGAQDVLERRMAAERQRGEWPALLSLDSLTGEPVASWHDGERAVRVRLRDNPLAPAAQAAAGLSGIRCNSLVGFPRPLVLFGQLRTLALEHEVPLAVEWHDHYLACPIHTLLDPRGSFCGLPAPAVCATCLASNAAVPAVAREVSDIGAWREAAGALLGAASDLRVFSPSSARIIARSFGPDPGFTPRVEAHSMDYFPSQATVDAGADAPLHIGVIGRIGVHKGAAEVAALAGEIQRRGAASRITVIGTIDVPVDRRVVQVTGAYRSAELPAVVRRTGVNVILLPSICPETFSFVAHEVIAMQMPLLAFDLGAQGDCAASYERGRVIEPGDPARTLEALEQLHAAAGSEGS